MYLNHRTNAYRIRAVIDDKHTCTNSSICFENSWLAQCLAQAFLASVISANWCYTAHCHLWLHHLPAVLFIVLVEYCRVRRKTAVVYKCLDQLNKIHFLKPKNKNTRTRSAFLTRGTGYPALTFHQVSKLAIMLKQYSSFSENQVLIVPSVKCSLLPLLRTVYCCDSHCELQSNRANNMQEIKTKYKLKICWCLKHTKFLSIWREQYSVYLWRKRHVLPCRKLKLFLKFGF